MELLQFDKFNPYDDPKKLGQKWLMWKQNFQHYLIAKEITGDERCMSTLMVLAGPAVQRVYSHKKLEIDAAREGDWEVESEYLEAMEILDEIFMKKTNESFQRALFRQLVQEPDETILAFVARLREQAESCNFPDQATLENALKDQIMEKGKSHKLRLTMWKKDRDFNDMMEQAQLLENAEAYEKDFKGKRPLAEVNDITEKPDDKRGKWMKQGAERGTACWSCNRSGHRKSDPECPAKNKQCLKCGKRGHFSVCCPENRGKFKKSYATPSYSNSRFKNNKVRAIESEDEDELPTEHVLSFEDGKGDVKCMVGGVEVKMLVDSGTKRNLLPKKDWETMKTKGVSTLEEIKGTDVILKAYGQEKPIPIYGRFKAKLVLNGITSEAWFYIVEKGSASLLGKQSGEKHEVLKIKENVRAVYEQPFPTIKGNEIEDEFEW